jgi:hypothetical protein
MASTPKTLKNMKSPRQKAAKMIKKNPKFINQSFREKKQKKYNLLKLKQNKMHIIVVKNNTKTTILTK